MIKGAKYWNNRDMYYSQENNPDEILEKITDAEELKKITDILRESNIPEKIISAVRRILHSYLETCGPTAAVNCLAALGYNLDITCPGMFQPQPEAVLMDWFHDIRNYDAMKEARENFLPGQLPNNRVPQFYPEAVFHVFNANADFRFVRDWDTIAHFLYTGGSVQLTLRSPGHYIACVAYDPDEKQLIYNDSHPERFPDKNGFNRRLSYQEYMDNVQPWAIFYEKLKEK